MKKSGWGGRLGSAVIGALAMQLMSSAQAADVMGEAPVADSGWEVYWPTYLWAAGSNGSARTLPPLPTADVDVSFSDSLKALKDLDAGLITTVFLHNDRLRLIGDVNWIRLSPEENINLGGTSAKLSLYNETFAFMGAAGYRVLDDEKLAIDVYGGAKFWYMDNSAKVEPAVVTPNKVDKTQSWVDGVVGAQILSNLTEHTYVSLIGFVGTGGSKFYGDAYGGVGYRFNENYDVFAGYRVMHVEREHGNFSYDVTQHGPLLGMGIKF